MAFKLTNVETEKDRIREIKLEYDWKDLDKNLRYLIYYIRRRLRKDWDIVVALSGEEGSGKSTLGGLMASLVDKKFNLIDNMALLPDEKQVVREYCKLNKYQCYVIDEAVRAFYKMNFMTTMTQTLVKMWATERYQNKATFLIIPRFTDLVENFRNHRVKLWIHVMARGRALVYIRDDDPHNNDPWSINLARKIKSRYNKKKNLSLLTIEERIAIERKLPNFLFEFEFPDYTPEFKKAYQKLKEDSREELESAGKTEADKKESGTVIELRGQRNELIYVMYKEKNMSLKEIEKSFNLSRAQVKKAIDDTSKKREEREKKKEKYEDLTGVHTLLDTAIKIQEQQNRIGGLR